MSIQTIIAGKTASITDLKRNPMQIADANEPVAILNHNKPVFYCVPTQEWEAIQEYLDDLGLLEIAKKRLDQGNRVKVSLDEL